MTRKKKSHLKPFDKYEYYLRSVQSPDTDAEFIYNTYRELRGRTPVVMREDFCAAFALTCAWVRYKPYLKGIAVDLDAEPLTYGKKNYWSQLNEDQRKRLQILQANVLDQGLPKADIINALNFSYFIFKKRSLLRKYFEQCYRSLKRHGIMLVDCFGGPECHEPNVNETVHEDFSYFWDQDSWDPITHEAKFYIHFKRKGEKKRERVFEYDWRMWTIPEIRELMEEVGFRKTHVYWEGTGEDGEGNGEFTRVDTGEVCESWIAYIVGEK